MYIPHFFCIILYFWVPCTTQGLPQNFNLFWSSRSDGDMVHTQKLDCLQLALISLLWNSRHAENILLNYYACISYTTQKLESVAQLEYMFVTIPAINTRSDPRILEGGGFVPFIMGVDLYFSWFMNKIWFRTQAKSLQSHVLSRVNRHGNFGFYTLLTLIAM